LAPNEGYALAGPATLFKISRIADDPPRPGSLNCTNP